MYIPPHRLLYSTFPFLNFLFLTVFVSSVSLHTYNIIDPSSTSFSCPSVSSCPSSMTLAMSLSFFSFLRWQFDLHLISAAHSLTVPALQLTGPHWLHTERDDWHAREISFYNTPTQNTRCIWVCLHGYTHLTHFSDHSLDSHLSSTLSSSLRLSAVTTFFCLEGSQSSSSW